MRAGFPLSFVLALLGCSALPASGQSIRRVDSQAGPSGEGLSWGTALRDTGGFNLSNAVSASFRY